MNPIEYRILTAYLCDSKSHRWIQQNIMQKEAPERGGGYEAMKVLHAFDLKEDSKGLLNGLTVTEENIFTLLNEVKFIDSDDSPSDYLEGSVTQRTVNAYERNKEARIKCIEHYGAKCTVCNFDFEVIYGKAGQGYIQVHHIIPLGSLKKGYKVNPIKDLVPLCANCHSIAHRVNPPYSLEQLKGMITS